MRSALILFSLIAFGCNNAPPPEPAPPPGHIEPSGEVVLTVGENKAKITQPMIDAVTRRVPPQQLEQMKAQGRMGEFEERMALGQVLYERALAQGLHETPEVQLALAMSQRDVLAAELIDKVGREAVTEEKLKEAYDKRGVQYKRPQVSARHILVKEKDLADEIKGKLDAGGDFAALANEHSTDPGSKAKGGELGWFEEGRMVKPFSDAAFAAEKGTVVGPVETRYGFHIIEVLDKRDAVPFEEVKDQLENVVKQQAVQEYMEAAKAEMKIERPGAGGSDAPATEDKPDGAADTPSGAEGEGH